MQLKCIQYFSLIKVIKENKEKPEWTHTSPILSHSFFMIISKELILVQEIIMRTEKIIGDPENTIGLNIRDLRISRHIGQTELVKQLQLMNIDITRETLVKIEGGRQHIKLNQLQGIKKILGVKYDDILEQK
jgi:DNA-binding Xre family transcriptional regulator